MQVSDEVGTETGKHDGEDLTEGWNHSDGEDYGASGPTPAEQMEEDRKCRPKVKSKARSQQKARKPAATASVIAEAEVTTTDALLMALLTLTDKVEAMERWTKVESKKGRTVTNVTRTDDSEDEGTDGTTAEEPKPRRRTSKPSLRRDDDSEEDARGPTPKSSSQPSNKTKSKTKGKPEAKKERKFYAVARGVSPGVYTSWDEACRQVRGFRNCKHKRFKTRVEAKAYVEANRDDQDSDDEWDESPEPSASESEASFEDERPTRKRRPRGKVSHPATEYMAPDPSMGKSKEFFKMTVADAKTMVNAMSPPGVPDYETRKLLAGATLDAVQLPGRCGTATENDGGSVAEAIAELAEDKRGEWAGDGHRRDVQWKSANRTSLKTIHSHDTLQERLSELQSLKGDTYENQVNTFRAIMSDLPWSDASIMAWAQLNWYQRIGLDTLENYLNLHRHLIDISLKQGWDYAAVSLAHHTSKLAHIRAQAPSRICCMVRIYIYLRDANHQSFYSEKLQEKRNREVMVALSSLKASGDGGGADAPCCTKCGMNHAGGVKSCPLKNLSDADARRKVKFVWEQLGKMAKKDWEKLLAAE
jgi:hypothetical protein